MKWSEVGGRFGDCYSQEGGAIGAITRKRFFYVAHQAVRMAVESGGDCLSDWSVTTSPGCEAWLHGRKAALGSRRAGPASRAWRKTPATWIEPRLGSAKCRSIVRPKRYQAGLRRISYKHSELE